MDLTSMIIEGAAKHGLPALMLCAAVYWLNRENNKQAKVSREAITALNKERSERIGKLECAVDECEKDRTRLWERVVSLALELSGKANQTPQSSIVTNRS